MFNMFLEADSFNQDLTGWCMSNILSEPVGFSVNSSLTQSNKPVWGSCYSEVCEISVSLTSGSANQTVTEGNATTTHQYSLSSTCSDTVTYNGTASGLPSGLSLTITNNTAIISGTPEISGTYNYSLTVSGSSSSNASITSVVVSGTITVNAACSILVNLTSGSANQTVTAGTAITSIQYLLSSNCPSGITYPGSVSGLPSGVSLSISDNIVTISGTPSTAGTYNYIVNVSGSISSNASITAAVVSGTIVVNAVVVVDDTTDSTDNSSSSDDSSETNANIYFENGTCKCPNASIGNTAVINGTTYTVVDNSTIQGQVNAGNINLCTTLVTNMSSIFNIKTTFNSNINFWDTSNVTDMNAMFQNANAFNQNIGNWDTSSVTDMRYIFFRATQFNQDLTDWCVTNISSEPLQFSPGSSLTDANKPVWGTCPD